MTTLRITEIPDDRPVRMTIQLPAELHRDLVAYAAMVSEGRADVLPAKLIAPMIQRFLASDRVFLKRKRIQLRTSSP
ncbi:MAG: DUF2274 domain-containing protein [Gluconacetobacter sp.]